MIITLVRHAQVIEEYQGKYNGHIDIPLSQKGKAQAKELAKKLANEKYDAIFCSDLLRAKQTLDAFSYDITPSYTQMLREKSWGRHEGMSFEEIQNGGIEYKNFDQWIAALDGEDLNLYTKRVEEYFFNTIFKLKKTNILIITHAGVIKTLLCLLKKCSLEEAFVLPLDYGSYIKLNTSKPLEFTYESLQLP